MTEPSVEDILASIKKVIAQDGRTAALERRKTGDFKPIAAPDAEAEDILELTQSAEPEAASDAPLVNPGLTASMRESLAALAALSAPGAAPQIVRSGETSLEGLVREMLRPMLQDWLNTNLPDMVESLVAKEIGRITRKG